MNPPGRGGIQGIERHTVLPQQCLNLCTKALHRAKDKDADNPLDTGCDLTRRRYTVRPSSYDDRCNLNSREVLL